MQKGLKIPKVVKGRRTDNTIAKREKNGKQYL
jgi:hypothetical protein